MRALLAWWRNERCNDPCPLPDPDFPKTPLPFRCTQWRYHKGGHVSRGRFHYVTWDNRPGSA